MDINSAAAIRAEEDAMKGRFLTFLIGEETYGIEIERVMEIIGMQPITEMPEMPEYMKGIINLRGGIIPAIDVRLRFQKSKAAYTDRTCIIVIRFGATRLGLIVDCVSEVLTIPEENIAEKPEISSRDSRGYIKNVGKVEDRIVLLIDCDKLLDGEPHETRSEQLK